MEAEEVGKRWIKYIGELFNDDRPEISDITEEKKA